MSSAPDGGDLRGALTRLPNQIERRFAQLPVAPNFAYGKEVSALVVCAAGDDALDAKALISSAGISSPVPMFVHSGERLPAFLGPRALVVIVALTRVDRRSRALLAEATASGANVFVFTASESFAATASACNATVVRFDNDEVSPRLLPGVMLLPLLHILEAAGFATDCAVEREQILVAVHQTTARCAGPEQGRKRSDAASLARRIGRTFPLVYGSGSLGSAAAQWWKSAVNQSAKLPAFASGLAAFTQGEFASFGQAGDVTRQIFTIVLLRRASESAEIAGGDTFLHPQETFDQFADLFGEVVAAVETVATDAESLAGYVSLALMGQWVAREMAVLAGVDPTVTSLLDEFWESLDSDEQGTGL